MQDDDNDQYVSSGQKLRDAINEWWESTYGEGGPAVLRSWYIISEGISFDSNGDELTHIGQQFDADIIQQLGLARYMSMSIKNRMDYDDYDDDDEDD